MSHHALSSRLPLFVVGMAIVLAACSSEGSSSSSSGGSCKPYAVPAGTSLTAPTVSFKTDVQPIFKAACAFSACHGSETSRNQGVYLGADPARTLTELKKNSVALASMPYVTASNPDASFLQKKIDGTHCELNAQCSGGTCGDSMPQGGDLLGEASRLTIRRWIAQGAQDN